MRIAVVIVIVFLLVAAIAFVIYHDTHNFVVREYVMESSKVKRDLTFVLLTDLHGYVFGNNNDRLINQIEEINPDYILSCGDMLTARMIDNKVHIEPGTHVLTSLASRYPLFISNGNHEEKIKGFTREFGNLFDRYKSGLVRGGVHYLENESFDIPEENIRISGLELPLDFFQKVVKKKMDPEDISSRIGDVNSREAEKFQILLAHNPIYFKEYAAWGADLTVSGHVHGGIIRLPLLGGVISPALALFPRYDGGIFRKDDRAMVLSRGLGTHTINVRFNNPGEVSVIKVRRK
ncbi:metallophosphoesterase [Butyrivibrio sp. AE2032]|uniref:metallophosphoesterase n=1 Tax=Butyrivibrio sp. AE2032 TaxID=1458463 RepID=UPI00068B132B|nr:metallophosphoesterase [Butyrivibrio sp. AE2032]